MREFKVERMWKLPVFIFVILFTLPSCYIFGIYSTHRSRVDIGDSVINDWAGSRRETARLQEEHQLKVDAYIARHADLDEKKKAELRSFRPKLGMTNEEVALFLLNPFEKIDTPQGLAGSAEKYWPELQGRVSEVWVYKHGHEGLKEYFSFEMKF